MELSDILNWIENADDDAVSQISQAVVRRYRTVYPGWEVVFLSLPREDREERRRQLNELMEFLDRHGQ